ncbi:histidine kinase [Leucobacter ruminantium]|uniref:histidine kinase n=1 Tax=Leucobacter ruminantium TaxID=1289170 RepID=A0A939M2A6_9MICO|nr:sensor histidine kinase [Leucobacter ruminantium]
MRPARWILDVLLGIGVTLVVSLFIAADIQGSDPDAWAYLWAVGLGGVMLVRRRYPVIVLLLSAGAVISYYAAGYPAIGVAVPLAAAVFSAAEQGRIVASIVTAIAVLGISVSYRLVEGQDPSVVVGYELPGHALLLAAAIALGDGVRARRELRRRAAEIGELTAERSAREAEQRAMAERLAIARELHDSVGHALTVVALHAQTAEEALSSGETVARDECEAREAVRVIATTTSTSFEDLRRTVASLRREDPGSRTPLRITDLESAILPARRAGLEVVTSVSVVSPLPPMLEAATYRIVQEAITNVVRHADASRVDVDIRENADFLRVSVVNDGRVFPDRSPSTGEAKGRGLSGMRERALLLGGTFSAGPDGAGFAVRASIPLEAGA